MTDWGDLADDRGHVFLSRLAEYHPDLPERLTAATRKALLTGAHLRSPGLAVKRSPQGHLWPEFWSPEAEACAWHHAGVFTEFVCGVLFTLRFGISLTITNDQAEVRRYPMVESWDYPGEPWHWLLERGTFAPRVDEARYMLVYRTMVVDTSIRAEDVADRLRRSREGVRAELDLEASMALARKRVCPAPA